MDTVDSTLITVIVLITGISALAWVVIGLGMRMVPRSALRFVVANLCLAFGAGLAARRSEVPSWFSYQGADWLVFLAAALFGDGIALISRQQLIGRLAQWGPMVVGALAMAVLAPDHHSFVARVLVATSVDSWYFLISFITCYRGLSNSVFPLLARLAVSWPFLAAALVMLGRCVMVLLQAQRGQPFSIADELGSGTLLWFLLTLVFIANIALGGLAAGRLVVRIRELAEKDHLTGCLNRRSLDQRLRLEMRRNQRSGEPLACVMFDLDHFKAINDGHGHHAGDAALRHAVKIAKAVLRSVDALGRFGGEEFVVLMPNTPASGAREGAERLRLALEANPVPYRDQHIPIRASFGVAVLSGLESRDSLIQRADAALYRAKHQGRNRVEMAREPDLGDRRRSVSGAESA